MGKEEVWLVNQREDLVHEKIISFKVYYYKFTKLNRNIVVVYILPINILILT